MASPGGFHRSVTLQALSIFSSLAVFVAEVQGGDVCAQFSCGHLQNISYPFCRRGDPLNCCVGAYELGCSSSKATIYINSGTYYVTGINYTDSSFWVVDASLDVNSSCSLPYLGYGEESCLTDSQGFCDLTTNSDNWACFVNCSRAVTHNSQYMPIACLNAKNSHFYVLVANYRGCIVEDLEPFCGYLAMRPFGSYTTRLQQNASYADIMQFIRRGFSVQFPEMHADPGWPSVYEAINICLNNSTSYYKQQISGANILNWTRTFFWGETHFLKCIAENTDSMIFIAVVKAIISAIDIPKFLIVLCRFLLAPLSVLIFLAQKYWKTRITIDAVEKFLRMQQMLGPMRIHHVNVVRLVGFCSEEMKRGLVYEYMPRGSLDKYIFSDEKCFSLDKLNEIALGIASGINYLHEGCDMQILHFDIKQHNILLDSNFTPKVADFGLAKLCPRGDNFVPLSALRGTVGYIAPEMISRGFGVISSKSDVYSFGMLLLEMAGGRRNADPDAPNSSQAYYPSWVYDRLTEQEAGEISIVDDMHELEKKLCIIGLWCIQMKSHDRPTMSEVIEMLEGGANSLQMPSRPFFCDEGHIHTDDTYHLSSELTEISEEDD
ncbi:hypothetical protein CFC21_045763 [Triticum aestivum]|uniref:Protein kinase domain-containing protein n=2 Tax=Triticum aestivum TaxID=4565 RepID=A0A3B6GL00_WHEAT|nr:uncharacterized protein LOC123077068 isoform X2 [Triticum aestivum]KAF7034795.1 hypothetical protein CFC21_045763 [Triticum aestivum]